MSAVATYAEALFEAALEKGNMEETLADLKDLVDALNTNEELRQFFYYSQAPVAQKRRVVDSLMQGMQETSRNFIKVLMDNGRDEALEEIVLRYEELVEEHLGRVEVELATAVELSPETLERVKARLGGILGGREVVLNPRVNPELLGGAVFEFGGKLVDGSVRGQFENLRSKMVERGVA